MNLRKLAFAIALFVAGCGPSQAPQNPPTGDSTSGDPSTGTPAGAALSKEECEAKGGAVVGDIGDGAIHRPDYVCASGKPPLGSIAQPPGGPVAIEGAVCCPK